MGRNMHVPQRLVALPLSLAAAAAVLLQARSGGALPVAVGAVGNQERPEPPTW